jgi:plastocyanin
MKLNRIALVVIFMVLLGAFIILRPMLQKNATSTPQTAIEKEVKTEEEEAGHEGYEEPKNRPVITIEIKNNSFVPDTLTVKPESVIVFYNKDQAEYTVTSNNVNQDTEGYFYVKVPAAERATAVEYEQEGTYTYSLISHPNIRGTIIVKK